MARLIPRILVVLNIEVIVDAKVEQERGLKREGLGNRDETNMANLALAKGNAAKKK